MKNYPAFTARGLGALALAASLTIAAAPASDGANTTAVPNAATWHQRMHERVQARLAELGKRLQIDAAQHDIWNAYVSTVESVFDTRPTPPPADADAATLTRFRAERAAWHAAKLAQIADATAKLQDVLDPEQRKILDHAVRRPAHGRGHPHHGHSTPAQS